MENAAKALIIAGGILIAIIIIAALVRTFSMTSNFQMSQLSEEEQRQLIEFNEQYTKYLNQYVYGTEVISVINNSLDKKVYPITVKIKFSDGYLYKGYKKSVKNGVTIWEKADVSIPGGTTISVKNNEDNTKTVEAFIDTLESAGGINTKAFKCTKVGYDNSNGRINSITFEEKQWGNLYDG